MRKEVKEVGQGGRERKRCKEEEYRMVLRESVNKGNGRDNDDEWRKC